MVGGVLHGLQGLHLVQHLVQRGLNTSKQMIQVLHLGSPSAIGIVLVPIKSRGGSLDHHVCPELHHEVIGIDLVCLLQLALHLLHYVTVDIEHSECVRLRLI